jgi:hypothetical protein
LKARGLDEVFRSIDPSSKRSLALCLDCGFGSMLLLYLHEEGTRPRRTQLACRSIDIDLLSEMVMSITQISLRVHACYFVLG